MFAPNTEKIVENTTRREVFLRTSRCMEIRSNADLSDFQSKLKVKLSYRNYVMSIFSPANKLDELFKV